MNLSVQMSIIGSTLTMRLKGDMDQASIDKLKYKTIDVIDRYRIKNIIMNFEQVGFMDSSGIGFIIGRYTQIKNKRGKIIICEMNEMVERIFNLSGLRRICKYVSNEQEANKILEVA